jgi:hypothetical protein
MRLPSTVTAQDQITSAATGAGVQSEVPDRVVEQVLVVADVHLAPAQRALVARGRTPQYTSALVTEEGVWVPVPATLLSKGLPALHREFALGDAHVRSWGTLEAVLVEAAKCGATIVRFSAAAEVWPRWPQY